MKIIGFHGKMGVGKSAAIEQLKGLISQPLALIKFAQPLYDMQEFIYTRICGVYTRPADFKKDRKLLQWIGTEWGRGQISQTLWIDLWRAEAERATASGRLVVCDDVRFDNEAEVIKRMGGIVVEIQSERASERINTAAGIAGHASEAGIRRELVAAIIENDGTIEDLKDSVTSLLSDLAEKYGD